MQLIRVCERVLVKFFLKNIKLNDKMKGFYKNSFRFSHYFKIYTTSQFKDIPSFKN